MCFFFSVSARMEQSEQLFQGCYLPSGWRREWQPTPVFLPGKAHRQRRLAGYSPRGCKESNMPEWLTHTHTHTHTHVARRSPVCPAGACWLSSPLPQDWSHALCLHCCLCTRWRRHRLTRIVGILALKVVTESSVQRRQLIYETELISHGLQVLQVLDILSFRWRTTGNAWPWWWTGCSCGCSSSSVCLELQGCFSSLSWGAQGIRKDGFSLHLQKRTDAVFIPPSPGNG